MSDSLPPELGPLVSSHGQASSREDVVTKSITLEDSIRIQIDRIMYLRSIGKPWGEAVYALRDAVVGLEDEQFFDGIPEEERVKLKELKDKALEEFKKKWAPYGWDHYPIRARRFKRNGKIVSMLDPSEEDLSHALRIIMSLLSRESITWRRRRTSILSEWSESEDEVEGEEDGVPPEPDEHSAE